jgi:hypothetical protein
MAPRLAAANVLTVAAIRLPQYDLVVEESVSGTLVERRADDAETIHELADRLVTIW